jgi:hypothetical protein
VNREEALRALVRQWRDEVARLLREDEAMWGGCGSRSDAAKRLERAASELRAILDASTWTPVAEALPGAGRRCWVWIEDAYGNGRKLLATRQVMFSGAEWWHGVRGEALDQWRIVYWQYEIVPPDPCREVTP